MRPAHMITVSPGAHMQTSVDKSNDAVVVFLSVHCPDTSPRTQPSLKNVWPPALHHLTPDLGGSMISPGSKPCPVVQSELRLFAGNTTSGLLDFMYWGPADKTPQDREERLHKQFAPCARAPSASPEAKGSCADVAACTLRLPTHANPSPC